VTSVNGAKWAKRAAWAVGGFLAFWVLAWLVVPPLLKWQAQQRLSEALGRSVSFGEVSFLPWTLELTVRDIAIDAAPLAAAPGTAASAPSASSAVAPKGDASAALLTIARLYVDADLRSIIERAPVIAALEVDAPTLRLARTSPGHYDIDDLIARFNARPSAEPNAEPARFALYNLKVSNASLRFDDQPVKQQHVLEALQLTLPFLANLPSHIAVKVEPRLAFTFNGTSFDTGAQALPFAQTRTAQLKLAMGDLDLSPYLGYLPESLPVRLRGGSVGADLVVDFAMAEGGSPKVTLSGDARVQKLAVDDRDGAALLAWDRLAINLRPSHPLERLIAFGAITLDAPVISVSRDAKGQLNLERVALAANAAKPDPSANAAKPDASATPSVNASAPAASATSPAPAPAASATSPAADSAATPWRVDLETLQINGLRVLWNDAAVTPAAALGLDAVSLKAGPLRYPLAADAAVPVQLQADLQGGAAAAGDGASRLIGRLAVDGQVSDRAARLQLNLTDILLDAAAPYVAQHLNPSISGKLTAGAVVNWAAAQRSNDGAAASAGASAASAAVPPLVRPVAGAMTLTVERGELNLDDLQLIETDANVKPGSNGARRKLPPSVSLKQFAVRGVEVDLGARRLTLANVRLSQPSVQVQRNAAGQWNVQRWLRQGEPGSDATAQRSPADSLAQKSPSASNSTSATPADAAANASPADTWRVDLRDLLVDGGTLRADDAFVAGAPDTEPQRFDVRALKLGVQNLLLDGARTTAPAKVQFSARLSGGRAGEATGEVTSDRARGDAALVAGSIDWRGQLGLQPLFVKGALQVERFPVQALEPYVRERLPVSLLRAEAGVKADVSVLQKPAGLDIGASGDVLIADVLVHSRPVKGAKLMTDTEELLSWQSFKLSGVQFAMAAAQPPRVDIAEAALSDFYSRLVITEQGRFNLQDIQATDGGAEAPADSASAAASSPADAAASSAPTASAPSVTPAPTTMAASPAPVSPAAAAASATPSAPDAPGPQISVGSTKLVNGKVDFTDRFVRPNYSAALSELNGSLGAFRSGSREMATLELRGRAAGTALLDISGQLNPTANPLALNIRARATDLELAPLSPYAAKYAGYAIERGKLSMDVSYLITPEGKLDAKNQVILNQLTFGDKVESPTATKLPVLLAVSLLKDRNGVIDINLPISGSISDPQFSVGGIIFKVIVNLLTKALTAPFSLLFGDGGEDMSLVEFQPGRALISESSTASLDKVAKALTDRPSLKMTVTGTSDPAVDAEGYVQAAFEARLLQEKKKELARAGLTAEAASQPTAAGAAVSGAEREKLVKAVYKQTDLPDKPRNLIGIAKDIPVPEMEAMLKARLSAGDEAMRELALQRGLAVRDALMAKGLPSERLFIASPKALASGEGGAGWIPKAQLSLAN
jgi:hypothetical protein